jgi:arylsulfatase A-like enzyme
MRLHVAFAVVAAACGSKSGADMHAMSDATAAGKPDAGGKTVAARVPDPPKPARTEHTVFKLVDNRHAAHRAVDGDVVIDASDIGFARHIRFGMPTPRWHLGQTVDGERAAIADRFASIEVPLTTEQAAPVELSARVHSEGKLAVTLKVNGRPAGRKAKVGLADGWQEIQIPIESRRFVAGENELAIETTGGGKGRVAFAWLRIGAATKVTADPRAAATFDPKAGAIDVAANAGLAWYVTVPEGANLVAEVPAPCHVEVKARAGDTSFAGGLLGGGNARVDLTPMAGKVVRLSLTARDCPHVKLTAPRITLHGPEPQALPKAPPPRYIVFWVMDAVRADRMALFTPGGRAQTPTMDELAKTGAIFRQYYVQGNESQTSHSTMWTGLYPAVHGIRLAGEHQLSLLNPKFDAIAPVLKAAGFQTVAVTGNGFINVDSGYGRGFDEFKNPMREAPPPNYVIFGNTLVDLAMKRFDTHRDQPTYLFLGTIDNHSPWVARKPWIDQYSQNYKGPFVEYGTADGLGLRPDSMGCSIIPPPADIERLRAIYDSATSYSDNQLGRVVAQLKSWGIWDQTMLIVTADHGEELFEETRCGHGGSLRDTLLRVPLLIHDPTRFPGGTIVEEGTEAVDLLPTVAAAVGTSVPAAQGQPLEELAQGFGRGWLRPSYTSMYEYAHAMRIGRWKARVGATGIPIVADMIGDPGETKDFAGVRPVERRMLTDNLGMFLSLRRQWKKSEWGVTSNITSQGAAALDGASTP